MMFKLKYGFILIYRQIKNGLQTCGSLQNRYKSLFGFYKICYSNFFLIQRLVKSKMSIKQFSLCCNKSVLPWLHKKMVKKWMANILLQLVTLLQQWLPGLRKGYNNQWLNILLQLLLGWAMWPIDPLIFLTADETYNFQSFW